MSEITEQPQDIVETNNDIDADNQPSDQEPQQAEPAEAQDAPVQLLEPDTTETSDKKSESQESGAQQEMPFALVQGEAVTQLPLDLYIPPDALEVILEQFEGPLDLLLYLIRKQNLDILEINVYEITAQYMQYVELMQTVHLELAGEYLVMAAMLAEIKSRILLPRPATEENEEEDPRAELIRRLQDYERFKQAAEDLDEYPRMGRDTFEVEIKPPEYSAERQHPDVDFKELMLAFGDVLSRASNYTEHEVHREKLSTRERMSQILDQIQTGDFVPFLQLFKPEEGRGGVVTTFLATLELIKEQLIEIVQNETFGPIHVKVKGSSHDQ
jgi:segregation and condensation protein A